LNPASDYGDIQTTIWQLFDQYAPTPATNYWLSLAQANYMNGNYSNFFVVTNTGPVNPTGQVQEFLTVLNPDWSIYPSTIDGSGSSSGSVATPEPALMGVVGLGLIGAAAVLGRARKRQKAGAGSTPPAG
jgi:hypothetical protein